MGNGVPFELMQFADVVLLRRLATATASATIGAPHICIRHSTYKANNKMFANILTSTVSGARNGSLNSSKSTTSRITAAYNLHAFNYYFHLHCCRTHTHIGQSERDFRFFSSSSSHFHFKINTSARATQLPSLQYATFRDRTRNGQRQSHVSNQ